VPDARRRTATSIYSVDEVVAVTPGAAEPLRFEPFYSFRHGKEDGSQLFWHARRRPTAWAREDGTDVYLSFVDDSARMVHPDADAVTARLTCYNADLPSRLPFGDARGDFEMPGGGPIDRVIALVKPTGVIEPPIGKSQLWRLISLLSLNYVSLLEGGADALRELLRLHNTADVPAGERQIQGILALAGSPIHSRIESEHGLTFARGHRVEIEFDEEQFAGGGVYLLAAVLERFLGLYVSLNSFCVLAAKSKQRKQLLAEWPPRSGWKTLL
jgi:type VI secretion system protein ImpG